MIGTLTESVARVLGSEGDLAPLGLGSVLGSIPDFVSLPSVDSEFALALADALQEHSPAELTWPTIDGLFSVRWALRVPGQQTRTGDQIVGASGGDWMERTYDAVNRVAELNGLENDSTWEMRDGVAVIRIWTGGRSLVAFVEEVE